MSKRTVIDMGKNLDPKSVILSHPVTESTTVNRRRVFTLAQLRADYRDAQTQLVVLLTQLHEEGFTGSLSLNFSQGRVCNVETIENKKL